MVILTGKAFRTVDQQKCFFPFHFSSSAENGNFVFSQPLLYTMLRPARQVGLDPLRTMPRSRRHNWRSNQ